MKIKKKGFITLATGEERYFKMAKNLLLSYRYFSKYPLPFAIVTDRRNEYTELFDDVVILTDPKCSYMDKIELLRLCPYKENIFIDADCVAYKDLNAYFDEFKNADDFSCFGEELDLEDIENGWFSREGAGIYRNDIKYIPNFHGGIYYIRPGETCMQMYIISQGIIEEFDQFKFRCSQPADEPILALAMSAVNCHPVKWKPNQFICYWNANKLHADIFKGKLEYSTKWFKTIHNGMLLHWGNAFTTKSLYRFEADKLNILSQNRRFNLIEIILYRFRLKMLIYYFEKLIYKMRNIQFKGK